MTWLHRAACRDHPTSTFFPDVEAGTAVDYGPAKAICAGCPVRAECLEAGLDEPVGIWGGLSPRAREKVARPRAGRVAPCTGCGTAVPLGSGRYQGRQPWCAAEECRKLNARQRNEAWRQRKGLAS